MNDRASHGQIFWCALIKYVGPYTSAFCSFDGERRAIVNWLRGNRELARIFKVLDVGRLANPLDIMHQGNGVALPKHTVFDVTQECLERLLNCRLVGGLYREISC